MIVDGLFWANLLALRECLCEELARTSPEHKLCSCSVVPGTAVDATGVQNGLGMAFVRLVSTYPSLQFPAQDQSGSNCDAPLAAQIEVGVWRCAPVGNQFNLVSAEQWTAAAELQMSDMRAMHRAITCCDLIDARVMLSGYTPYGPDGGVLGGSWSLYLEQVMS